MAKVIKRGATRKPVRQERPAVAWQHMLRHLIVVSALASILALTFYLRQSDTLPIKHVTVEGEFEHVDKASLVKAVKPYTRGGFLNVDVAKIRQAGEALPWVRNIQVRRIWPDSLHLIVQEQVAIATWRDKALLNQQGDVFLPSKFIAAALPQLRGPESSHKLVAKRYMEMESALQAEQLHIQRLVMDKRRAWSLQLNNGLSVMLGRADSEQRFNRFIAVYQDSLQPYQSNIAEIDMRYPNGFSVLWKPQQTPDFNGTV